VLTVKLDDCIIGIYDYFYYNTEFELKARLFTSQMWQLYLLNFSTSITPVHHSKLPIKDIMHLLHVCNTVDELLVLLLRCVKYLPVQPWEVTLLE